MPFWLV